MLDPLCRQRNRWVAELGKLVVVGDVELVTSRRAGKDAQPVGTLEVRSPDETDRCEIRERDNLYPTIVSFILVPRAQDASRHGEGPIGVSVHGSTAFLIESYERVWMIDVSEPRAPEMIGSFFLPSSTRHVELSRGFALTASNWSGVQVVDVQQCLVCPADLDNDGDADAEDFFAFLDAFAAGDVGQCDLDGDGDCDADDFSGYLDLFATGC